MSKLSETVDFIMSFVSRYVTVCTVLNESFVSGSGSPNMNKRYNGYHDFGVTCMYRLFAKGI